MTEEVPTEVTEVPEVPEVQESTAGSSTDPPIDPPDAAEETMESMESVDPPETVADPEEPAPKAKAKFPEQNPKLKRNSPVGQPVPETSQSHRSLLSELLRGWLRSLCFRM